MCCLPLPLVVFTCSEGTMHLTLEMSELGYNQLEITF